MSRLPLPARLTHDAELLYVVLPASSGDRLSSEGAALSSLSQRLTVKGSEKKVQAAFVTMASRVLQVQRPSLDGPLTAAGPGRGEK